MNGYMILFFIGIALIILLFSLGVSLSRARNENERIRASYYEEQTAHRKATNIITELSRSNATLSQELETVKADYAKHKGNLQTVLESNLSAAPWLAGMMADFLTYDLEVEALKLDWGNNIQRQNKVASIRSIRAEAERRIEEAKYASYQLSYLLQLFPNLSDVLESDYKEIEYSGSIPEEDPVRGWLTKEEWHSLSEDYRNQLALERYISSRNKTKWQIGRDYELSIAYEYLSRGFDVDTPGSYQNLEDMGRDLIAKKADKTYIIQCKYWSEKKLIHEKHIFQLYGTTVSYMVEHPSLISPPIPVFVTNITLSPKARQVAEYLHVVIVENHPFKEFPRIKCNIGKNEYGPTKIYHLPMDDQYDKVKICNSGECYAFTVKEAVQKGFRRAYKWHGNS